MEKEIMKRRQDLETMTQQIHAYEDQLAADRWRNECFNIEKAIKRLEKERKSVAADAEMAQMDPEEARALMLAKVTFSFCIFFWPHL